MENTSLIALSRQAALKRQMDVVANNIANMNTTAFKGEKTMFVDQLVRSRGGDRSTYEQLAFVRDIATMRDPTEGPLKKTDNTLDVAVRGSGFFVVDTDDGERYTRNGTFRLDQNGQIVTQNGRSVLSTGGAPIFFTPADTEISISADGSVGTNNGPLGKLRVVRFDNEYTLRPTADGLYITDSEAQNVDRPDVVQGMLEGSNVEPVREMANMIEVQRAYESAKTLVEREHDRIKSVIRDLSGGQ